VTASALESLNGVMPSSVNPRRSSNALAARYAARGLAGRERSFATSDSSTPMYSG
jgi:hypothetical protein